MIFDLFKTPASKDETSTVMDHIRRLWGQSKYPNSHIFPMPIDLSSNDLKEMSAHEYVCAPKHDGERVMVVMLCIKRTPMTFVVTRRWQVFSVVVDAHVTLFRNNGTMIDCELIIDESNKKSELVMFDCYFSRGHSMLIASNYWTRLRELSELIGLFKCVDPILECSRKTVFRMSEIDTLSVELEKNQTGYDGVIFTPVNGKCKVGSNRGLFKFKFESTVDLLFSVMNGQHVLEWGENSGNAKINSREARVLLDTSTLPTIGGDVRSQRPPKLSEFGVRYDRTQNAIILRWRKYRDDKTSPNYMRIVEKIFKLSMDKIDLLTIFSSICKPLEPPQITALVLDISEAADATAVKDVSAADSGAPATSASTEQQSKHRHTKSKKRERPPKEENRQYLRAWAKVKNNMHDKDSRATKPVKSLLS